MRVLIFGFKPFLRYPTNISEAVVRGLPRMPGVTTHIFDVRFEPKLFRNVFDRVGPDLVIGLGQHPRARKIRVERRAKNRMWPRKKPPGRPIERNGPPALFATLAIPPDRRATITYNAGSFVCNYSMWMMSRWCEKHGARWAFLHVSKRADAAHVAAYVRQLLRALRS